MVGTYGKSTQRRTEYHYAISELASYDLLDVRRHGGELTVKGYQVADELKKNPSYDLEAEGKDKVKFSDEERTILTEVAATTGRLQYNVLLDGVLISTGLHMQGAWRVKPDSPRSAAKWKAAIDNLEEIGLLKDNGNGVVFELQENGFEVADKLKDDPDYAYEVKEGSALVLIKDSHDTYNKNHIEQKGFNISWFKDMKWVKETGMGIGGFVLGLFRRMTKWLFG